MAEIFQMLDKNNVDLSTMSIVLSKQPNTGNKSNYEKCPKCGFNFKNTQNIKNEDIHNILDKIQVLMSLLYATGLHALLLWVDLEPYNRNHKFSTEGWKAFSPSVYKVMQDPGKDALSEHGNHLMKLFIKYHSRILDEEMKSKESLVFKTNSSSDCVPHLKDGRLDFLVSKLTTRTTQTPKTLPGVSIKSRKQDSTETGNLSIVNENNERKSSDEPSSNIGEHISLDMEVTEELSADELSFSDEESNPNLDSDESFHLSELENENKPTVVQLLPIIRRGRPKKSDCVRPKTVTKKISPADVICPCMKLCSDRQLSRCPKCHTWWHDICAGVDCNKPSSKKWLCKKCNLRIQGSDEASEAPVSKKAVTKSRFNQNSFQDFHHMSKRKEKASNPGKCRKTIRKHLRATGQEYVTIKGKKVPARKIGPDCKCKRNCYKLVDEESRRELFNHYYNLGNTNKQNAYLTTWMVKCDVKRRRRRLLSLDSEPKRSSTFEYNVLTKGKIVQICKVAFCNIHSLSTSKICHIRQKMSVDSLMPPKDLRGKHRTRKNRISQNSIRKIKNHISSFTISYLKVPNSNKLEIKFPDNMNLKKMFQLYADQCREMNTPAEKESRYRLIFRQMFISDFTCTKLSDSCLSQEKSES